MIKKMICRVKGHVLVPYDVMVPEAGWSCERCGDYGTWIPWPHGTLRDHL